MKNQTLDTYCLALGISDQQLADLFDVSKRTARRWRSKAEIPEGVGAEMQQIWDHTINQIRQTLNPGAVAGEPDKKSRALALLVKDVLVTGKVREGLDPFTFADTLDARRLALGVSVKDFAELIGVSTATATRWLNGAVSGKGPYLMAGADAKLCEAEDWVEAYVDGMGGDGEHWPLEMRKVADARKQARQRGLAALTM